MKVKYTIGEETTSSYIIAKKLVDVGDTVLYKAPSQSIFVQHKDGKIELYATQKNLPINILVDTASGKVIFKNFFSKSEPDKNNLVEIPFLNELPTNLYPIQESLDLSTKSGINNSIKTIKKSIKSKSNNLIDKLLKDYNINPDNLNGKSRKFRNSDSTTKSSRKLADNFLNDNYVFHFKKDIFIYVDGQYRYIDDEELKRILLKLKPDASTKILDDALSYIKVLTSKTNLEEMQLTEHQLPINGGYYDGLNGTFYKQTPDKIILNPVTFNYIDISKEERKKILLWLNRMTYKENYLDFRLSLVNVVYNCAGKSNLKVKVHPDSIDNFKNFAETLCTVTEIKFDDKMIISDEEGLKLKSVGKKAVKQRDNRLANERDEIVSFLVSNYKKS